MNVDVSELIRSIPILIALGACVWKLAIIASNVKENSKDIGALHQKLREFEARCAERGTKQGDLSVEIAKLSATIGGKKCLYKEDP